MAEDQATLSTGGVEGGGNVDSSAVPPINKWASRPKVTIGRNERLKRNVLEINLDVDTNTGKIEKESLAKLFTRMGMRTGELEGFQIKRRKVFAWLVEGTDLARFITDQCFQITPGMKTSVIKPMDKREVQVLISGININTPDSFLFSYLAFFGKVSSHKVIYDTERDGPLAGVKNGDRRFLMDFTSGKGMGTYHLVDGESVIVSYSGQRRTCGRCHQDSRTCPGGGWARACEEKKTPRLELREHMQKLWAEIGFKTDAYELGSGEVAEEDVESEARSFTPPVKTQVSKEDKELFSAVQVRNLPDKVDMSDLMTMLKEHGLPEDMDEENVTLGKNGRKGRTWAAKIGPLSSETCNIMIENIDKKVIPIWDKLLHCVGVSGFSPVKPAAPQSLHPNGAPPVPVTTPSKRPLLPASSSPAAPAPPSPSSPRAPPAPLILSQVAAETPSLPDLAKSLPGVSIQPVVAPKRPTKAERKKVNKEKKAAKLKPIRVKTPGAPVSGSSGDESSSDEEESEAEKLAKKKKAETKKLFRSDSSLSVKEMAGAYSDLGKKHKLSPPQPEERRKRNKEESTN